MKLGGAVVQAGRRLFAVLVCVTLVAWSSAPTASQLPKVIEILEEHAAMTAAHGHSHGLEDDLIWVLHGHSHDVADYDHSQAVFMQTRLAQIRAVERVAWLGFAMAHSPPPHFRLERPPRM